MFVICAIFITGKDIQSQKKGWKYTKERRKPVPSDEEGRQNRKMGKGISTYEQMAEEIFTDEQRARITYGHKKGDSELCLIDLHGMTKNEARRFAKNVIALHRSPFTLAVIHGYNGGDVLKEMVRTETLTHRSTKMKLTGNPGMTYFEIA